MMDVSMRRYRYLSSAEMPREVLEIMAIGRALSYARGARSWSGYLRLLGEELSSDPTL